MLKMNSKFETIRSEIVSVKSALQTIEANAVASIQKEHSKKKKKSKASLNTRLRRTRKLITKYKLNKSQVISSVTNMKLNGRFGQVKTELEMMKSEKVDVETVRRRQRPVVDLDMVLNSNVVGDSLEEDCTYLKGESQDYVSINGSANTDSTCFDFFIHN